MLNADKFTETAAAKELGSALGSGFVIMAPSHLAALLPGCVRVKAAGTKLSESFFFPGDPAKGVSWAVS